MDVAETVDMPLSLTVWGIPEANCPVGKLSGGVEVSWFAADDTKDRLEGIADAGEQQADYVDGLISKTKNYEAAACEWFFGYGSSNSDEYVGWWWWWGGGLPTANHGRPCCHEPRPAP